MTGKRPEPSKSVQFPLSPIDAAIVDAIPAAAPPGKWPAFNSMRHLNRAWKIREVDPPMAYFRCITAEEEAATALFHALRRWRYAGCEKLNHRCHVQKNAVVPFLEGIRRTVARVAPDFPKVTFEFYPDKAPPNARIRIEVNHSIKPGEGSDAFHPDPPLNFTAKGSLNDAPLKLEDFSLGLEEVRQGAGSETILKFLSKRANLRNDILYAKANGYPEVGGDLDATHRLHKDNVFRVLRLYLLVDQYSVKQDFVQQCLLGFLKMLDKLPDGMGSAFE